MKLAALSGLGVTIAFALGCGSGNGLPPGGKAGHGGGGGGAGGRGGAAGRGIFVEGSRLKAVYEEVPGAPPRLLHWYDTSLGFECDFVVTADAILCRPNVVLADFATLVFADSACTRPATRYQDAVEYFDVPSQNPCSATRKLFRGGARVATGKALYFRDPDAATCTVFDQGGLEWQELGEEIPLDTLVSGKLELEPGGGRIVATAVAGSDGSRQNYGELDGWDTERGERVRPGTLQGVFRWRPTAALGAHYFADAACTTRAAEAYCWDTPRKTVLADVTNSDPGSGYFDVGPAADRGSIYQASGGCMRASVSATSSMFHVGAPIAATAFAEAGETRLGSGQVTLTAYGEANGGAPAIVGGFFDTLHHTPCQAAAAADGIVRCLPTYLSPRATVAFLDSACSAPIAYARTGSKPPLAEIRMYAAGASTADYYPVLDGVVAVDATYGLLADGTCSAVTIDRNTFTFYTVGSKISVDAFVAVTTVRPQ